MILVLGLAGQNKPRLPIRVCDEAAITLCLNYPDLKFHQAGKHADLDKQIAVIRQALAQRSEGAATTRRSPMGPPTSAA